MSQPKTPAEPFKTMVACPKPQTKSEIAAIHLVREQKNLAAFGTIGFDAYVTWILNGGRA